MVVAGDERCRSQGGNNNAYCHDNEISWIDWAPDEAGAEQYAFVKRLIALRQEHPVFRRSSFFASRVDSVGIPDAWWFRTDGRKMAHRNWEQAEGARLGVFLNGMALGEQTLRGEAIVDDSFVLLFNTDHEPVEFTLPTRRFGNGWTLELTTADPAAAAFSIPARGKLVVEARSVVVLRRES
jgi:glycogen operon protein